MVIFNKFRIVTYKVMDALNVMFVIKRWKIQLHRMLKNLVILLLEEIEVFYTMTLQSFIKRLTFTFQS